MYKSKKVNNKEKGITLIALIITIIILLILAGVTINVLIGDKGLLNTAKQAGEEYIKAGLKEEIEIEIVNIQSKKYAEGKEFKREDLVELADIGATMQSYGIPAEGEYKNYFFEIDENNVVTIIGKLQGERPNISGEIITTGAVEAGGKVEIKVTASINDGTITSIEPTNGAILKPGATNTDTEKTYEVDKNGIYYFKVIASNKRSNTAKVEVKIIQEKPIIAIQDIKSTGFKIVVTNNYEQGLVKEYKYYVEKTIKSSANTTTKEYTITELEEDTEYKNIYVEAIFDTGKLASESKTAKTLPVQVNEPKVAGTGLIPVTINADGSLNTVDETNKDWYNYVDTSVTGKANTSKWANAKTADGSMWVWIPRYAYKITYANTSNKSQGGIIDVVFLKDDTNKDFNGKDVTDVNYVDKKGNKGAYIVHPAFKDGTKNGFANGEWNKEITGFWVAKYVAGYQYGQAGQTVGTVQYSNLPYTELNGYSSNFLETTLTKGTTKLSYPVFKANTYAYNIISAGDAWMLSQEIDTASMYGLSNVNSHMVKNSEWGAIAYLTHSKYGVNGNSTNMNEVAINKKNLNNEVNVNNAKSGTKANVYAVTSYGSSNTPNDVNASSTKNMTGVFDLNGCVCERVVGFLQGGSANTPNWYSAMASSSTTASTEYLALYTTNNKKGDATNETAGWNSDYSNFIIPNYPVFKRGGCYDNEERRRCIFLHLYKWLSYLLRWLPCVLDILAL